jgi:hypothetical protein
MILQTTIRKYKVDLCEQLLDKIKCQGKRRKNSREARRAGKKLKQETSACIPESLNSGSQHRDYIQL